jgi:hypothetical protein
VEVAKRPLRVDASRGSKAYDPPVARRYHSVATQLVTQSRDAALTAVQVFNNPQIKFKSETFIVLMNIAWTYLLHAHYRRSGVEYRHYRQQGSRRRFDRTADGSYRYWDLSQCLATSSCPVDNETKKNLIFLIGLRNEISHHMSPVVDQFVSARYACCLNYNRCVKELFGERLGVDRHLGYSLQFQSISREQLSTPTEADLPPNVRSYIAQFDGDLTADELNSERFAFRMLFVPKLVGKPGQADEVIEFLKPDSDLARSVNRDYVSFKEVERPKYLPGHIVRLIHEEGYRRFTMHSHTVLWQRMNAKKPGRGFGVEVAGAWYWYASWIDQVRRYCDENADIFR